jgi:hypothetical protein
MREGDTFWGNPDWISRRLNSLGLNLACEGLLLGMQDKGPSRFRLRSLPRALELRLLS